MQESLMITVRVTVMISSWNIYGSSGQARSWPNFQEKFHIKLLLSASEEE